MKHHASNLRVMASTLVAMASNLRVMASNLVAYFGVWSVCVYMYVDVSVDVSVLRSQTHRFLVVGMLLVAMPGAPSSDHCC